MIISPESFNSVKLIVKGNYHTAIEKYNVEEKDRSWDWLGGDSVKQSLTSDFPPMTSDFFGNDVEAEHQETRHRTGKSILEDSPWIRRKCKRGCCIEGRILLIDI